jgi:hypothetical protein
MADNPLTMRSVAVLLFALVGVLAFQGCGSSGTATVGGNPDGGTCNVAFCPQMGMGTACCAGNACGFDHGMGCVATFTGVDGGH